MSDIQRKNVTVRKPHMCAWCAQKIEKGEDAVYRVYNWCGCLNSDWQHPECFDDMNKVIAESGEIEWVPGEFKRPEVQNDKAD